MSKNNAAGYTSIALETNDLEEAAQHFAQQNLQPTEISNGQSRNANDGRVRRWRRLRLDTEQTFGLRFFVLQIEPSSYLPDQNAPDDSASSIHSIRVDSRHGSEFRTLLCEGMTLKPADQVNAFQFNGVGDTPKGQLQPRIEVVRQANSADAARISEVVYAVADLHKVHKRITKSELVPTELRKDALTGQLCFSVADEVENSLHTFVECGEAAL
jgi:hypothetical protein